MKKLFLALTLTLTFALLSACGLAEDGPLRVGMDPTYPPFETTKDGEPHGISVDVANELGDYLGREIEIVETDFGSLIPSLNSGEIDIIIGSMSITEEREKSVDFSEPYFYFPIISLLNQEFADTNNLNEDSEIEALFDIDDVKYVGLADQISYEIPESMGFDTQKAQEMSSAVSEVVQGERDVLIMSPSPVVNNHNSNEEETMILWDPVESSPIGMAVREGDEALLEDANGFIAQMEENGVYERLIDDWEEEVKALLGKYGLEFYIYAD